jgi:ABC-type branched-subunit amino acid transport system ATPase component
MSTAPLLEIEGLEKRFGGLRALAGVDLVVRTGEIVGLIGPNGAGKTTLFHAIMGTIRADGGAIRFGGAAIDHLPSYAICRLGLARTYQTVRPFLDLDVLENVVVGAFFGKTGLSASERQDRVNRALAIVGLSAKAHLRPRQLNLVERKMVELARALATDPKLLLLDELLSGLNPTEMAAATGLIRRLRDEHGITIIWVEHVMRAVMATCPRVVALHFGRILIDGTPAEVASDPEVVRAYLGAKGAEAHVG